MIQAIIFDFDGTLIDTNPLDFEAWERILKENGANISWEAYIEIVGATSAEIFKQYLHLEDQSKVDELVSKREEYFRQIAGKKGLKLLPGAENLLKEIQEFPLKIALATGGNQEKLDFIFKQIDIRSYFDEVITANEVTNGKPNPEVFLTAAQKLKVPPKECVVFEDAKKGVEAAIAGGMQCIAINTNGRKELLSEANLIIEDYSTFNLRNWLRLAQKGA